MKKCKYCQSDIDVKAKICPNCRRKQSSGIGLFLLIVFGVIMVISSLIGIISSEDIANEGNVSNEQNKPTEKFTYEIIKQYSDEYGISYYIEGSLKNNRDNDYSYVQIEFVCYDKDGNNLGTAFDNTNNLLGNQTWKFKAMAMFSDTNTVDHCEYHDITSW